MNRREKLIEVCQRYCIGIVYLFGSQAELGVKILEDKRPRIEDKLSDIDLGVVFREGIPSPAYRVYSLVYGDLEGIFSPFGLDLVFLQETNYLLQFEAIKGIVVYSVSEKTKDDYEEMVLRFAADWKYEYDLYQQEVLEAIKDGYFQFEYDYAHR